MVENKALRENRFNTTTNIPPRHTQKHPHGYLTPLLKRFLKKTINYEDPETQKIIRGKVKDAVMWRLILNATQGETHAIKEILDRIDGKLKSEPLIDQSQHYHFTNIKQVIEDATNHRNNRAKESLRSSESLAK